MEIETPQNLTQLSRAAFTFGHREHKWTFSHDPFENVSIQEYWTEDLSRNGEDTVTLFKGAKHLFKDICHFIGSVTILLFEDGIEESEHLSTFEKFELTELQLSCFETRWTEFSRLVQNSQIQYPAGVIRAYSSAEDWNFVTLYGESPDGFHGLVWETSA